MILSDSRIHHNGASSTIHYGRGANITEARNAVHSAQSAVAQGMSNIMLDMSKTATVNEYDLHAINRIVDLLQEDQEAKLKVLNPSPAIRRVLEQEAVAFTDFYRDM